MLCRLIVVLAITLTGLNLPAQAPAPSSDHPAKPKNPPGTCAVSGRVVSAAEGTPLRSARVALIESNARQHPQVYATTTDNDGHFEIKQIEAGRYEFFATHIGYVEQRYQSKGVDDSGVTLSLSSGQTVEDATFQLIHAGVISGKIVDDVGEPLMRITVSVLHKPSEEKRESEGSRGKKLEMTMVSGVQTDDRGEYRVFDLKPGEYYVRAADIGDSFGFPGGGLTDDDWQLMEALGGSFAPIYYPGVLQLDQAQMITVGAGEEAQADFAMRKIKMVEVAGRVIGPDGRPPNQASIQLFQAGVGDWAGLDASVDSRGEFSIKGVAPGSYMISAGMREKDKFYTTRRKVEVGETKIDSLVLTLGNGATIHGRIRTANGAPLPSNRNMVHLQSVDDESGTGYYYAEVNKDGTFELNGVADGSYTLMPVVIGDGWFTASAYLGNEDALQDGVQVEGGAAKGSLEIVLSNAGAQIEGSITDTEKGEAVAGVVVKAQPDPSTDYNYMRSRSATTDQNGRYVLKDVPPHKYKITAKLSSAVAGLPAGKSEVVTLTVTEHDHRVMDFKLTPPKTE